MTAEQGRTYHLSMMLLAGRVQAIDTWDNQHPKLHYDMTITELIKFWHMRLDAELNIGNQMPHFGPIIFESDDIATLPARQWLVLAKGNEWESTNKSYPLSEHFKKAASEVQAGRIPVDATIVAETLKSLNLNPASIYRVRVFKKPRFLREYSHLFKELQLQS